jgi:TPR repeat protein
VRRAPRRPSSGTKAAELGDSSAMSNLGACYENGTRRREERRDGRQVVHEGGRAGRLATRCSTWACATRTATASRRTPRRPSSGTRRRPSWATRSAMINLGVCYENGRGVEKNAETAVKWYTKAAELGDSDAMFNLGVCYENGMRRREERRDGRQVVHEGGRVGQLATRCSTGRVLRERHGVEKSAETAVKWYTKAAELGNSNAMFNLGVCYENGTASRRASRRPSSGTRRRPSWATRTRCSTWACATRTATASRRAPRRVCYENGTGVDEERRESRRVVHAAIELGDASAMFNLAVCYENGTGVRRAPRKRSSCTSARLSWATLARCSTWRCATRTAMA